MKAVSNKDICPCGTGQHYRICCQPLHLGQPAPSALALMRSRYSAYVLGLADYLLQTWHKDTRPAAFDLKDDQTKWLGLSILRTEITGTETAIVEFIARYKLGGHRAERLHETSVFIYTDAWYYVTGELT